jgi:asparagine N-glycosylation enzyme membrane subunit Stt3
MARPGWVAVAPFTAFLIVAGVGAWIAPTEAIWVGAAVALLLAASVIAIVDELRKGSRAVPLDLLFLGAGASLAFFTALYVICSWYDPGSILLSGDQHPIKAIGEAALLSLTLGGTVGTIGIDLAGSARIVAFIQLLLTLTAVGAALTWAWQRLIDNRDGEIPREGG